MTVEATRITLEGIEYELRPEPVFRCASCERVTSTALCGCSSPAPSRCGEQMFAYPVAERTAGAVS